MVVVPDHTDQYHPGGPVEQVLDLLRELIEEGGSGGTGPTGPSGADGATGPAGAAGANGADGSTGPTGAAGSNGSNGPTGAAGSNGSNGADGATGPTGAAGANGSNGSNGAVGATGPTGAAGAAGSNGSNGAVGATGPTGPTGFTGAAGGAGAGGVTGPTGGTFNLTGVNRQAASYTLVLTDAGKAVEMNNGSANNLTVPPNSSVAFPVNTVTRIVQYGAGQTTIVAGAGVTLRSNGARLKVSGQYLGATLYQSAADEWIVAGDLTT